MGTTLSPGLGDLCHYHDLLALITPYVYSGVSWAMEQPALYRPVFKGTH